MTAAQLRDALKSLGLSQSAGARLLGVDGRTMRRWCAEPGPSAREVPPPVERFLWFLVAKGIGPDEVTRTLEPFGRALPLVPRGEGDRALQRPIQLPRSHSASDKP